MWLLATCFNSLGFHFFCQVLEPLNAVIGRFALDLARYPIPPVGRTLGKLFDGLFEALLLDLRPITAIRRHFVPAPLCLFSSLCLCFDLDGDIIVLGGHRVSPKTAVG